MKPTGVMVASPIFNCNGDDSVAGCVAATVFCIEAGLGNVTAGSGAMGIGAGDDRTRRRHLADAAEIAGCSRRRGQRSVEQRLLFRKRLLGVSVNCFC